MSLSKAWRQSIESLINLSHAFHLTFKRFWAHNWQGSHKLEIMSVSFCDVSWCLHSQLCIKLAGIAPLCTPCVIHLWQMNLRDLVVIFNLLSRITEVNIFLIISNQHFTMAHPQSTASVLSDFRLKAVWLILDCLGWYWNQRQNIKSWRSHWFGLILTKIYTKQDILQLKN